MRETRMTLVGLAPVAGEVVLVIRLNRNHDSLFQDAYARVAARHRSFDMVRSCGVQALVPKSRPPCVAIDPRVHLHGSVLRSENDPG